ncbi:MAG: N-acetyl-gamma-glutamyl-phosphate reductase [Thermodesulfobacteriota bacterium]|nr:N-acetyl-gamma-glutamyl-phosphate reductase [Thermodesulfobacteriota bacterium]
MLKVSIIGASGYTGQELIRLLIGHPHVELVCLTSRALKGKKVSHVFSGFKGKIEAEFTEPDLSRICSISDFIFSALPHKTSMEMVPIIVGHGKKVVDLSADFRFSNVALYEQAYQKHTCPDLLKESVYGAPEIFREQIRHAKLVANPGCYPISTILALWPLVARKLIDCSNIVVDSKSGVSGAGRNPHTDTMFCEVNEGFKAYKIGTHRHAPEIEEKLTQLAEEKVSILFVPHLVPMNRGILTTVYAQLVKKYTTSTLLECYHEFYRDEKFVRIYPEGEFPTISSVRYSNFCDIGIFVDKDQKKVVIISTIDNLVKGASGQAIQNMNVMMGFDEDIGVDQVPI